MIALIFPIAAFYGGGWGYLGALVGSWIITALVVWVFKMDGLKRLGAKDPVNIGSSIITIAILINHYW
jgi:hypothetical protein